MSKPNATEPINVLCVTVTVEEPHALVFRDPIQPTLVQSIPGLIQQLTLPTPVRVNLLSVYLDGYDQEQRSYLINDFVNGFPLGIVGLVPPSVSQNHSSVSPIHSKFIRTKLGKEISLGRVMGPYNKPPLPNFKSSPLCVVPKKEPNTFRLIHNLSFGGEENSVHSFIPFKNSTVSLETFDHVVALVLSCGNLISTGD